MDPVKLHHLAEQKCKKMGLGCRVQVKEREIDIEKYLEMHGKDAGLIRAELLEGLK